MPKFLFLFFASLVMRGVAVAKIYDAIRKALPKLAQQQKEKQCLIRCDRNFDTRKFIAEITILRQKIFVKQLPIL